MRLGCDRVSNRDQIVALDAIKWDLAFQALATSWARRAAPGREVGGAADKPAPA
jgi:hypothetical protein